MNKLKDFLNSIEAHRGSKKIGPYLLVAAKDVVWFFTYFIPFSIFRIIQHIKQKIVMSIYNYFDRYRDEVATHYKISFCITCMNRLSHLKKTLRTNLRYNADYPNIEFVLLDYNSADGLQSWVLKNFKKELASGSLAYYKTAKPKYFHMANAKNIAHNLASGDIVCNLDADNFTGKDFAFYINLVMQKSMNIIGIHSNEFSLTRGHISDCGGRIFLSKANFLKLGGYNESFVGWGHEDIEFKKRASLLGLKVEDMPRCFLGSVRHDDSLRVKNMNISIKESTLKNESLLNEIENSTIIHINNAPIDFEEIKRIK